MFEIEKTDQEWREILSPLAYKVTRKHGTERAFSHDDFTGQDGHYACVCCGSLLFSHADKFDSGTGWPSFTESLPGAFITKIDYSFGIKRVEYHCAKCGVHHGHVFDDGSTSTQKRFCSNGLCLIFKPEG